MRILCSAKDSHIFSTKNNSVFVILMFEILTKRYVTTSLVLNNWAQYSGEIICLAQGYKGQNANFANTHIFLLIQINYENYEIIKLWNNFTTCKKLSIYK